MDLLYLAGIVLFWGLCVALTSGCEHLRRRAPGSPLMNAWMIWLAAASTLLLFVYLVYALLRAEDLE